MEKINYKLFDGSTLSKKILSQVKDKVRENYIKAKLAIILVGKDPASELYVKKKGESCLNVGIESELIKFEENVSQEKIIEKIEQLNKDDFVTGILVQLPLPKGMNSDLIINSIFPKKDVDGLTNYNKQIILKGDESLACATPKGILRLIDENDIKLQNKKIVLVGNGKLVGQPLSLMLKNRKLEYAICDKGTKNNSKTIKNADVLITATGIPHLIKENSVKEGVIIIDAGTSKLNGKIVGDVDFEEVKEKAKWITPVKGGVGPMTVAILIENIINAYYLQKQND